MRIARYNDSAINLVPYARWFVSRPAASPVSIPTDTEGVTLVVGFWRKDFMVLIKDGRKAIGAVHLRAIRNRDMKRAFGFVVEPHSYVLPEHRGRRLVEGVYRWALDNGLVFCSSPFQSSASNGLWRKLSSDYRCELIHRPEARRARSGEKIDSAKIRLLLSSASAARSRR